MTECVSAGNLLKIPGTWYLDGLAVFLFHQLTYIVAEHPFDLILESLLAGGAEIHPDDVGHFPNLLNQRGRVVLGGGVLDGGGVGGCV